MKRRMGGGKKSVIFIVFCVLVVALSFARDVIIRKVLTVMISRSMGVPTHIGGLSISVIRQSIKITDFKMYSPEGFPPDMMVDIPLIYVFCDIGSFLEGKIHFREVFLNVGKVALVRNKDNKLNVDFLKARIEEQQGETSAHRPVRIDWVQLKIGRVINIDYTVHGPPARKVYNVNIERSYRGITSDRQLMALIIAEPLKATGAQALSVYGVSMLTGISFFPVAAAFVFTGSDSVQERFDAPWSEAFGAGMKTLEESGRILRQNKEAGSIVAGIRGSRVAFRLRRLTGGKTQVDISARRFLFPQPEVAAGFMYSLEDKLK